MTRFARAKGSKSSNEKKPEDATPWAEIKNSMLLRKSNKSEKLPLKKEIKIDTPKPTEWASLGNSDSLLKRPLGKKNKNKEDLSDCVDQIRSKLHKEEIPEVSSQAYGSKVKKNKKRKLEKDRDSEKSLLNKKKKLSKSEKSDYEVKVKKQNDGNVIDRDRKSFHKIKKTKKSEIHRKGTSNSANKNFFKKPNKQPKERNKFKNKDNMGENSAVEELNFNGEKIQIVKFQGFWVTLEDAERLRNLRNEMIKAGIPKDKLEAAIKLERRRAEKALSRFKKSVCFHCRGHGHLLSHCPALTENENTSTGVCYKCGSSEHFAAKCKVVRGTDFQFAECFICNEQGHIARQCPDNPRGLYPQGGACRECGDVTHLRKDCPLIQAQKEEKTITARVANGRDLECLDEEIGSREKQNLKKEVKKSSSVKF